jgi:hypothetical protein
MSGMRKCHCFTRASGSGAEIYKMINHPNRNTRSRLCENLEDAIYELGEVGHYGIEFKDIDGQVKETGVFFGGKSAAIETLAKIGIVLVVRQLKEAIAAVEKEALPFKEMHDFFMSNPAATSATPSNFDPESPAGKYLSEYAKQWNADANMEAGGDSASFDGYLRSEALLDYNLRQKRAQQLTTALGACQKALSDSPVARATAAALA